MKRFPSCTPALLGAAAVLTGSPAGAIDIEFEEMAVQAGIDYVGPSFGSSWGDFDEDGDPDLYISNHFELTALLRNDGDGKFSDASPLLTTPLDPTIDAHTGAWADFDDDGDRDLLIVVGAQVNGGENRLLVYDGAHFSERAAETGIDLPLGRGRAPLWFDWNADGRLDVVLANWPRSDGRAPTSLYTQTGAGFVDDSVATGMTTSAPSIGAQLLHVAGADQPLLLIHSRGDFPDALYDTTAVPFVDMVSSLGISRRGAVDDVAIGDFDGDLEMEMYLARRTRPSAAVQTGPREIRASINGAAQQELGISFSGGTSITVAIGPRSQVAPDDIYLGSSGTHPAGVDFELDADDPQVWGKFALPAGTDGVVLYFDTNASRWHLLVVGAKLARTIVGGDTDLQDLQTEGFVYADGAEPTVLLDRVDGAFTDVAAAAGLPARPCASVVRADFDNDMDLDVYLVCNDAASNLPNVLLENDGTGRFTEVADAAGATGSAGGRGDTASAADFDSDGFVDLLVTNGRGDIPLYRDGPTELFRNVGNGNRWIQIDLVGTETNADGIGALVYVEAGGMRQVRARDGGMHRFSQDHSRLHYGLGPHERVAAVDVVWPDGKTQTLTDLRVDQILTITELGEDPDTDADGIADTADNCLLVANSQQTDTDQDNIGNACDPDIAVPNDCLVNIADLALLRGEFLLAGTDDTDFNDDGVTNFADLQIMRDRFFAAPGPSGLPNSCE